MEDFTQDDVHDYLHLTLDLALKSEKFFIIIGRQAAPWEEGDPITYHIEGQHHEDVLASVEATINSLTE